MHTPSHKRKTITVLAFLFAFALYPIFAAGAPGNSAALLMTVTPNRDGKNDTFIFRCYNPWDFRITATIYGLRGERLASMRIKSDKSITYPYDYLEWDPDSGARAPGGLYLYEVIVNNKAYKGTVAVIR